MEVNITGVLKMIHEKRWIFIDWLVHLCGLFDWLICSEQFGDFSKKKLGGGYSFIHKENFPEVAKTHKHTPFHTCPVSDSGPAHEKINSCFTSIWFLKSSPRQLLFKIYNISICKGSRRYTGLLKMACRNWKENYLPWAVLHQSHAYHKDLGTERGFAVIHRATHKSWTVRLWGWN